jgi:hypothetical protein
LLREHLDRPGELPSLVLVVGDLDLSTRPDIGHPAIDGADHDPGILRDHYRDHAASGRFRVHQDRAGLDLRHAADDLAVRRAREVNGILWGLRQAKHQHHRTSQERQASDRGTEHDEASNDGLHFLTC